MAEFKTGDYVRVVGGLTGLVIEVDVNLWGEEENPPGVVIMLSSGEMEVVYEDEAENLLLYTE